MTAMRRSLWLIVAVLLLGCGHDGGSSGSSQVLVGTYLGTVRLTATAGPAAATRSGPVTITVSPDHFVMVGRFPGATPIHGTSFALDVPASILTTSTLSCVQGTFTISGTFIGTVVTGPITSSGMVCNGFPVSLTGSYVATLQTERLHAEEPAGSVFQDVLRQVLPERSAP